VVALCLPLIGAAAAPGLFEYDASLPLDVQSTVLERPAGAIVHDLAYASPRAGRVTAYLVVPEGKGPFAGVLFGHWGGGNRTEFLPEAILYARAGVVSLLPDYPWTRPAPWRRELQYSRGPENDFDVYVQAVIDLRRGIDLLLARADVDPSRVGYVGHSYGAQWGAILSAIDRRIRTAILVGGVPDLAAIYLESDDPDTVALRASDPDRVRKLLDVMAPLAAAQYVGQAAPTPLFFQFARYEQNFPESAMRRYYAAASEPKAIAWYPTGHDLNDPAALLDRAGWLRRHLGIARVSIAPARAHRRP
jgi:dienelactone hydrolase